jgi:Pyruvate/2-oxoacid:ferredoxin oxidoreductase delta subunit
METERKSVTAAQPDVNSLRALKCMLVWFYCEDHGRKKYV